jgi:hypothetical protein
MKTPSYFQQVAARTARLRGATPPRLQPTPLLFRPSATALDFVEINETRSSKALSAVSNRSAPVGFSASPSVVVSAMTGVPAAVGNKESTPPTSSTVPGPNTDRVSTPTDPFTAPFSEERLSPKVTGAGAEHREPILLQDSGVTPIKAVERALKTAAKALPRLAPEPLAPRPPAPITTAAISTVHIGTLEVRVTAPAPVPAPALSPKTVNRAASRAAPQPSRLSRSLGVFGLGQG